MQMFQYIAAWPSQTDPTIVPSGVIQVPNVEEHNRKRMLHDHAITKRSILGRITAVRLFALGRLAVTFSLAAAAQARAKVIGIYGAAMLSSADETLKLERLAARRSRADPRQSSALFCHYSPTRLHSQPAPLPPLSRSLPIRFVPPGISGCVCENGGL